MAKKRKLQIIFALSICHFIICLTLGFLLFLSTMTNYLGTEFTSSDQITAWFLMILLFPVRNIANLLVSSPDQWLHEFTGLFVISGASIIWGIIIYYSFSWLIAYRRSA